MTVGVMNSSSIKKDSSIWGHATQTGTFYPQYVTTKTSERTLKQTTKPELSHTAYPETINNLPGSDFTINYNLNPFAAPNFNIDEKSFVEGILNNTFLTLTK